MFDVLSLFEFFTGLTEQPSNKSVHCDTFLEADVLSRACFHESTCRMWCIAA